VGNLKQRDYLEDLGIDGRIISTGFKEIMWDDTDSIHLALDRDKWWPLVNMVLNLQVP
jgi:hypothetical protein